MFNLASLIAFYGCMSSSSHSVSDVLLTRSIGFHFGLGKHLYYVDPNDFVTLFKFLYVQNAAYYTCAGIVKLSLLCQYLRLFQKGVIRQICIVLMVLTGLWAFFWFFQGWFPCFPVSGFWNRTRTPPAKCWGTGFGNVQNSLTAFVAFAATNMMLDTIIFFIPIMLYFRPGLGSRQVLAIIALFTLGSV